MVVQNLRALGVPKPIQQIPQPLNMGAVEKRGQRGELSFVNPSTEVGKYGRNSVDAASDMDVVKQVERRQLRGWHLHGAGPSCAVATDSNPLRKWNVIHERPTRILGNCQSVTTWKSITVSSPT
jgi:hypothetical protein